MFRSVAACFMFPAALLLLPAAPGAQEQVGARDFLSWRVLRSFEKSTDGYITNGGGKTSLNGTESFHGEASLSVKSSFPGEVDVLKPSNIGPIGLVDMAVKALPAPPPDLACVIFVKNKDGLWWQSEPQDIHPPCPGGWCVVRFDLYEMYPVNHQAPFDRRYAAEVAVVGFRFFSRRKWNGEILLDRLRGRAPEPPELAIRNIRLINGPEVPLYQPFEAAFRVDGAYFNPFDPSEIQVDALITKPSGNTVAFPCFFYQDFERTIEPGGRDSYIPRGRGEWRLRFAPLERGTYRLRLQATSGSKIVKSPELTLQTSDTRPCLPPIRVSRNNPYSFATVEGASFYPIGHNLRSPTDSRCTRVLGWSPLPDRGLSAYENYLPKMASNGENLAEIWMAAWWLGIEWNREWKGYHGLGRYNLQHAWMLDYLLNFAAGYNMYVHLVIDNHGKLSSYCDPEWQLSPYNRKNGGFLSSADHFFTDPRAKARHKQKLRYIIARWGAFTNILGFELISELDLTGERHGSYKRPYVLEWHREMTRYFRSLDDAGHLLTTHFSGDFHVIDPKIANDPCIDYVVVDAYRGGNTPFPPLMHQSGRFLARFNKPFMITEYGGAWNGTDVAGLRADLHSGLWAAACSHSAGTPLLWWFDFIDREGLYGEFAALRKFLEGEDNLKTSGWKEALIEVGGNLWALLYNGADEGRMWVFDARDMTYLFPNNLHLHEEKELDIPASPESLFEVQYWNTHSGELISVQTLRSAGNSVRLELPPFRGDIAVKWERTGTATPEVPSSTYPGRRVPPQETSTIRSRR